MNQQLFARSRFRWERDEISHVAKLRRLIILVIVIKEAEDQVSLVRERDFVWYGFFGIVDGHDGVHCSHGLIGDFVKGIHFVAYEDHISN
jgi:hypothetical protein